MELKAASLRKQPFCSHGQPLVFVSYETQQRAHAFLHKILRHPTGLGLLRGPLLAGKTTLIRAFAESVDNEAEIAVVDGDGLNTKALLEAILSQFGYQLQFNSVNELISMLKVYVLQRTASEQAPMLIIENTHTLPPSGLRVLCELAELRVRYQSALRMVLVSDRSFASIIRAPAMEPVSARLTGEFYLGPMTEYETTDYLHEKLRAGGCPDPDSVIPEYIANEFHTAAGGWPGILDGIAREALVKAPQCPIDKKYVEYAALPDAPAAAAPEPQNTPDENRTRNSADVPQLYLTKDGETVSVVTMHQERLIIGRSEHNDLQIASKFISRNHAMLIRNGPATFLMDLNSTNGTYVNSSRVSNHILMHNDIISLGNHRIKFVHNSAVDTDALDDEGFADTVIMKSLQDMRRMLAEENTQIMAMPPQKEAAGGDTSGL